MSWQLDLAIRGDLKRFAQHNSKALGQAVAEVVNRRARGAQTALRQQLTRRGLAKLAGAVRRKGFPPRGGKGEDARAHPDAAAWVYSKAIVGGGGRAGLFDLLAVFDQGATVQVRGARCLAIPTAAAGSRAVRGAVSRRARPSDYPESAVRVIPPRDGKAGRIVRRSDDAVLFWLVRGPVRVPKRLSIAEIRARFMRPMGAEILRGWTRRTGSTTTSEVV